MESTALNILIFLPLIAGIAVWTLPREREALAYQISLLVGLIVAVISFWLWWGVGGNGLQAETSLAWIMVRSGPWSIPPGGWCRIATTGGRSAPRNGPTNAAAMLSSRITSGRDRASPRMRDRPASSGNGNRDVGSDRKSIRASFAAARSATRR